MEGTMMRTLTIVVAVLAVVALGELFFAGKSFTNSATAQSLAASSKLDCEAEGATLNALLDTKRNSPNIARATAEFERGVAECMWGRLAAANVHYREASRSLRG
jgi:hypothetical protein